MRPHKNRTGKSACPTTRRHRRTVHARVRQNQTHYAKVVTVFRTKESYGTRNENSFLKTRLRASRGACSGLRVTPLPGKYRRACGLQIVESHTLGNLDWLVHGFSTRPGGISELDGKPALNLGFTDWDQRESVAENRAKFAAALSAGKMPLVTLRQFHSDVIHVADAPEAEVPRADALATRTLGLLLGVQTADCVPILMADTRQRAVAAIHAGWRGTLARIVVKTLGRMQMEFGTRPRDVVASLGPAIGRCCYEVGPEVAQAFAAQFPTAADWFDGPFEQPRAWRRAALAAVVDDDAAGTRAASAARATRPARRKSLATDRCRSAGIEDRGQRSLHGLPHGSAVQLSPRRRKNRPDDGSDWDS